MNNKHEPALLVVGPAWVGDMVMAQSLFKLLKAGDPHLAIDVLAPAWTLPVAQAMPEIRSTHAAPFRHGQIALRERYRLGKALRTQHYKACIVLPSSLKAALVPFWAKIPQRIGYRGEFRYGLLNDIRPLDKKMLTKTVQRFCYLGQASGTAPKLETPRPQLHVERAAALACAQTLGLAVGDRPIFVLCPGAEYGPAKRWPAAHFAQVAQERLQKGWQVWILGSPKDQPDGQAIDQQTQQQCIDLTGRTDLSQAIALLSLADAVLCNDSGLMHVAAALQRPVFALYGSSDPNFTPPLSEQAHILSLSLPCSPCMQRECKYGHTNCLRQLAPELVVNKLHEAGL